MALRTLATRRILRPVVGLAIAGTALVGFAGAASADSSVSNITAKACGGSTGRDVTVSYTTNAAFSTGVRILAVLGSPSGNVVKTVEVPLSGISTVTITVPGLDPGTYWFDWQDADGGGIYSDRHSNLGSFYNGIYLATETPVAECVIATTTTAAPATTTTLATTTTAVTQTTAATTTTSVVVAPPTTPAAATTTTTVAVNPPTTVVRTTAAASANTLPSTGANQTPLIAAGVAFLGLGMVAVLSTRRRPARQA